MNKKDIRVFAEMARRKVQFHNSESWETLKLWGLFDWKYVEKYLNSGQLITTMRKENKTIWVYPNKETWEKIINPMIEKYSLDELSKMAEW